jgi:hypothetical protein
MAVLGNSVVTLVDVAKRLDPDGKIARIAELLNQENAILDDITWTEGNLPTGNRTTIRAGLPGVSFRALNEGVPRSKSNVSQFDEGAAMLEGFSEVDRKEAILSGEDYRYAARAANISRSLLTKDMSTGADLQDVFIQLAERVQNTNGRAAFYAPRTVTGYLRRQLVNKKNGFLSWDEIGGRKVLNFDGIPIRRVDAMNVQEARVV